MAKKVLLVCLGNICRSPLAEVVMRACAIEQQVDSKLFFSSAGTGDWHIGRGADQRSAAIAKQHGLDLSSHRAQQVHGNNWSNWHWFVAMDHQNYTDLLRMGVPRSRLLFMRQFEGNGGEGVLDVPDPYYGGASGFEDVYQMLQDNAEKVIAHLLAQDE